MRTGRKEIVADKYGSLYDHIVSYKITAMCREPLHVGGGDGRNGGILVHPVENIPFIQATGIAGALRDYLAENPELDPDSEIRKTLFGSSADGGDNGSKVRISDAFFYENVADEKHANTVNIELRPRVKINRESGTCQTYNTKGGANWSGQKFETELIAAGSVLKFSLYLYEREHEYEALLEKLLCALHAGEIQIGGQKSNGCGYIVLSDVVKTDYDMTNAGDRKLWKDEKKGGTSILGELEKQTSKQEKRIHFELHGEVDSEILVKSIAVSNYDQASPDAEQMRTADGRLVIPATSIKGVLRSQMEKIAKFKGIPESEIESVFGKNASADKGEKGFLGCIHFFDAILDGGMRPSQMRIHIDKFTGGVMYGELFSETPAYGKLTIRVDLEKENKKAAGLLLMALRDLGLGILPLGSGSNIGRGYISGTELSVWKGTDMIAKIDLKGRKITEGAERIKDYVKAV